MKSLHFVNVQQYSNAVSSYDQIVFESVIWFLVLILGVVCMDITTYILFFFTFFFFFFGRHPLIAHWKHLGRVYQSFVLHHFTYAYFPFCLAPDKVFYFTIIFYQTALWEFKGWQLIQRELHSNSCKVFFNMVLAKFHQAFLNSFLPFLPHTYFRGLQNI